MRVLASLLAIALLVAGCLDGDDGGTGGGDGGTDGGTGGGNNTTAAPLSTVPFSGTVTGGGVPGVFSFGGGDTDIEANTLTPPQNASRFIVEVQWTESPNVLQFTITACEGTCAPDTSNMFASQSGDAPPVRLSGSVPGGDLGLTFFADGASAQTPFDGVVSFFEDAVPGDYTALGG